MRTAGGRMVGVDLGVLGPMRAVVDGRPVTLGGPKPRAVLALLVLAEGRPASTDKLAQVLWGDRRPATAVKTLQKYVSLLRAGLGDPELVITHPGGYALATGRATIDRARFDELVDAGVDSRPDRASELLEAALALWRGDPYVELGAWPAAQAERTRLGERRLDAVEGLLDAQLARGRHRAVVARLEELVAAHPLRERLWELLMLALYRSRRQGAALEAYQRLRTTLVEQLGIDPSPELRELHERILRQDPGLDALADRSTPADLGLDAHAAPSAPAVPGHDARTAPSAPADPGHDALADRSAPADPALHAPADPSAPSDLGLDAHAVRSAPADLPARVDHVVGARIPVSTATPGPRERPTNLPAQLTSFVGRQRELEETAALVMSHRLVTVVGAAGAGKTRLALELGERLVARYPDGVWLIELAALRHPEEAAAAAAATFRLPDRPARSPTDVLTDFLVDKRLLLLIDNCEHLVDAAATLVATVLRTCEGVDAVATSREPLAVAGEQLYELAPLPVRGGSRGRDVDSDAVRLLVDRARAADVEFTVTDDNGDDVARICRRLDGLPLAIELAAARLRAFAPAELADALGDRFDLLRAGDRTAPAHHQTLQAAIDWSHDLLSRDEQVLFRRLAVFRGGFDLEGVTDVCAAAPLTASDVLRLLPDLVDRSLVVADRRPRGGTRYRLLATLRAYAAERLAAAGEGAAVRDRCSRRFVALVDEAADGLQGPQAGTWLERLDVELDNLRAVLAWSLEDDDDATAQRVAAALHDYWEARGRVTEGRRWLSAGLDAGPGRNTAERRRALVVAGMMAAGQGHPDVGESLARDALRLGREAGDELATTGARHVLALAHQHRGEYGRQEALLTACLERYRRLGRRRDAGLALHHLGMAARLQGRYARARDFHEQAIAVFRETGEQLRIGYSLWMLGVVALHQGDLDVARARCGESLALLRSLEDRSGEAHVGYTLGDLARTEGDLDAATSAYRTSLRQLRELGDRRCVASTLRNLGVVALERERADEALGLLGDSLRLRQRLGDRAGVAECMEGFARGAALHGRPDLAARLAGAAERLRDATGARRALHDQRRYEGWLAEIGAGLGADAFAAAVEAGRALGDDDAADEALALSPAVPAPPVAARPAPR